MGSTTTALTSSAGPERYHPAVPFSTKLLNEGEDIVLDLHPHWEFFLKPALALVAALALGALVVNKVSEGAVEFGSGLLVLVALGFLTWQQTRTWHESQSKRVYLVKVTRNLELVNGHEDLR